MANSTQGAPRDDWAHMRSIAVTRLALNAIDGLLTIVLAPRCASCDQILDAPLSGPICAACWGSIRPITPPLCDGCGDPRARGLSRSNGDASMTSSIGIEGDRCRRCRRARWSVDRGRAVGEYDGALREIIHALKYQQRRSIAPHLARLMRERGADVLGGADALVPVPLHPRRLRARGFNQAHDLAAHLGPPVWSVLRRVRHTPPQVELPAGRRRGNVRGAFAIQARTRWPGHRRAETTALNGLCLVLIDDVSTTGATLEACARALKKAGAREIRALTAARVVRQSR